VRGGKRNSASVGKAERKEMSGPRLKKESVTRRIRTAWCSEHEYCIATARLEVVCGAAKG
jgi:hypothetical protein